MYAGELWLYSTEYSGKFRVLRVAKILVVDDIEENIVLLRFELEDEGHEVLSAHNGQECLDFVSRIHPDLIFLDISMPVMDGMTTLQILKHNPETREIPVIMVSANEDEEQIVKALDVGAHDYVSKPFVYPILAARMRSALRIVEQQQALADANASLAHLASQDPLTEVYNRRYFLRRADIEFCNIRRHDRSMGVIMIDADHFKSINDRYGHAMGDQALLAICRICKTSLRASDFIGRLGGEEFAICCPETDIEGATQIAERIREGVESVDIQRGEAHCNVSISVGVTAIMDTDQSFDQILQRADKLLYQAKNSGRNCVQAA